MATVRADPGAADWSSGTARSKRVADQGLYDVILAAAGGSGAEHLAVLSLPAAGWVWERGLALAAAETLPGLELTMVGVERDAAVHKRMWMGRRGRRGGRASLIAAGEPCSAEDVLSGAVHVRGAPDAFDVVYLDWMGTWSLAKEVELLALFDGGRLAPGGLVITTVMLGRGHYGREFRRLLRRRRSATPFIVRDLRESPGIPLAGHVKVQGMPLALSSLARGRGVTLEPVVSQVYTGGVSRGGVTEVQTVMRRSA
jgi:hypothetical protein